MSSLLDKTDPVVSVNIVTYNRRNLLEQALRSVLNQTFSDFEILVIDDGSTDGTGDLLRTIGDPRILCVRVDHCGTIARLRNLALASSRGRYIALLDSDDAWAPNKLETQIRFMIENGLGFSATGAQTTADRRPATGRSTICVDPSSRYAWISRLLMNWTLYPSSVMFARESATAIKGFREDFVSAGDADFILRLIESIPSGNLCTPLLVRATHEGQHSASHAVQAYHEMLTVVRRCRNERILSPRSYRRAVSIMLYRLAGELRKDQDRKASREAYRESLRANPLHWRAGVRWMLS